MAGVTGGADWRVPVIALCISAFAINTAELIIAGILPPVAAELGVDIPTAGLLITGYALGVAILGPVLALLTAGIPRRVVLVGVMVAFVIGNILCALATSYWMLLGARIVVAACHGLFFGVAMVLATRLAPEGRKTTAVSLVIAGVTVANVMGIPIGTAIGNSLGWRATFWFIAAAGAIAAIAVPLLIPAAAHEEAGRPSSAMEIRAAGRPVVLFCYAAIAIFMVGVFVLYSYIVPLLTTVSGVPVHLLPWVLFGMGFTGFFGNLIGGRLGDWNPMATMIGILIYCAVMSIVLWLASGSAWGMPIALWATWFLGFGFAANARSRILQATRDAPTFASTLTSTAFNIGIAAGAAIGGAAINAGLSYGQLPLIGSACFTLALLVVLALAAYDRRVASLAPAPGGAV